MFSIDPLYIKKASAAGVAGVIVDWENRGKVARQARADTEINYNSIEDLKNVRASTNKIVICRINGFYDQTPCEVENAIAAGADEILLPMVKNIEEVEKTLDLIGGRCGLGIMIETLAAVQLADSLAKLPVSRAYAGLNDMAIERQSPNIFTALIDGTVESIRNAFTIPFGFGGLTLPEGGCPVPCRLLIGEMARLRCDFSVLRRSFYRDTINKDVSIEIPRLLQYIERSRHRSDLEIQRDRKALVEVAQSIATAK